MLVEFRVANFRSFREEQTLSLVASRDCKLSSNLIPGEEGSLLKAVAVYGANASGKSNLMAAISQMRSFVVRSATMMNQGDRIEGIVPFRLAPEFLKRPSLFEVTLILSGVRYIYGFSATAAKVHGEWLMAFPKGRKVRWFERQFDEELGTYRVSFGQVLRKWRWAKQLKEMTRDNGLVLSRGAELNLIPFDLPFRWFHSGLYVLNMSEPPDPLSQRTAEWIEEQEGRREKVARLLHHADLGISGLKLGTETVALYEPQKAKWDTRPEKAKIMRIARPRGGPDEMRSLRVRTEHAVRGSKEPVLFPMYEESNGTQRLFSLAGPILDALDTGASVVVDELECSLHPLLTRALIGLFQSAKANPRGAQLVFATHDTTLLDSALFRRDQLWLVEKDSQGASRLFSLYDFKKKPRITEALERNYLAGRYGGVPSLGPVFEDSEL